MARGARWSDRRDAMKNFKRWVLGFLSSLFLASGLARAADRLDPINRDLNGTDNGSLAGTPDSVSFCDVADDLK
jgi:hypothetical protein